MFFSLPTFAQPSKIEGRVLDRKSNEPLIGVNVSLVGEKAGTVSNQDGSFTITAASFPATLSFSYLGFRTMEIDIYEYSQPLTIFLSENLTLLNEVVVIGYGTQKRKELTGSVVSVPQSVLSRVTSSFDNLLGGAIPGVNVIQNSGQPGATSTIRVRGGNSINGGNEPLYVIDGFIVYNDNSNSKTGTASSKIVGADAGLNLLSTINPSDIESIEILKDASATAIYGTRGANGVIIITTKKGVKGTNKIHYQSTAGWQQISKKLNLLNGSQWASLRNDILDSSGDNTSPRFTQSEIEAFGEGYDWQSKALRAGFVHNHQLSISGGDEKTRYVVSGNYFSQDGIIKNTDFERYSFRVNLDREVFKNLRIGLNAIGSHSTQNGLSSLSNDNIVNTWVSILRTPPIVPIYNTDGSYNYKNPYSINVEDNTLADIENTISRTILNRVLGNFFAEYRITSGLTAKVNAGADLINSKLNYFAPPSAAAGKATSGLAYVGTNAINSWQSEFTLNYEKRINDNHAFNVLAGYTAQRSDAESVQAVASHFLTDKTKYNSLQSGAAEIPYSNVITSTLQSFIGRINYSYLERYNLTATLRADGSSRFGPQHQWGIFPSLGVSWVVSDEEFLKDYQKLSNLKVRLSVGTVGNQEIGNYQYESRLGTETYSFNRNLVTGYIYENKGNSDLRWEKTTQYNLGFDAGFLNDRLNVTIDAYYKKTTDLLLDVPTQTTTGYASVLTNIGSVSNKGLEIGLNANIIKTKTFNWISGLNWSKNVNKVLDLGGIESFAPIFPTDGALSTVYPTIVKVGEPLGTFYGYQYDGVVQVGDDLSKVPNVGWITGDTQYGNPKFADQPGVTPGNITPEDKVILGNTQPDFIVGFNNTFSYRKLDFSFLLQGNYGNKLYNALRNKMELTPRTFNAVASIADRWTPTNTNTDVPRALEVSTFNLDSRYIEDASFLKVRNITLGYTIPFRNKSTGAQSFVRVFGTAQNVLTFTKYTGYDPEASRNGADEQSTLYQGVDYGAYPSSKSFSVGVEINF
ncbi:MAG: TonB-dependent receptor [Candidatus Symbiothrix sp.]|jgi:TonB-linked SusC/RagA family outer membrane protein|nr:TonB-dependent receptor [Candidatus Symbiothrix sp.]